jgi:phage terminase small subunit
MSNVVSLTAKQARFVDEYLVDGNGAAAAVRAGYSEKTARAIAAENLTKPAVLGVLREKQTFVAAELQITRNDVIRGLAEAFEIARTDRNPAAMISAMASLAKLLGFNTPEPRRLELNTENRRLQMKFESMSDEELMAIADGRPVGAAY